MINKAALFYRECPKCQTPISYTNKKNKNKSEKTNKRCRKCVNDEKRNNAFAVNKIKMQKTYLKFDQDKNHQIESIFQIHGSNWDVFRKEVMPLILQFRKELRELDVYRNCPKCDKKIKHANNISRNHYKKLGSLCRTCSKSGEKNTFYGKKHSTESIEKILESRKTSESWQAHLDYQHSDEFKKHMKDTFSGENNPRYGLGSLKDIWTTKYGEEIAEEKYKEWKENQIKNAPKGKDNHMFGKPSPQGSGNGWSGWYKGWFFRSINELSFMICVIERFRFSWENGELKKYKIQYIDWEGKTRNYFPDFILNGKYMVECKPKRLHNSINVQCKAKAAIEYCKQNNMIYKLVDFPKISQNEIKELYENSEIKFMDRYEIKFKERYYK